MPWGAHLIQCVPMESISPTLALAVLLFGISGNTNEATQQASIDTSKSGCPDLTDSSLAAAPQSWTEAFSDASGSTVALPVVIDPKWSDSEPSVVEDSHPPAEVASAAPVSSSDPITRNTVPTGAAAPAQKPKVDPCGPGQ